MARETERTYRNTLHKMYPNPTKMSLKAEMQSDDREKIEDFLRFFTHAGETRFPIFAWGNLQKLSHFVN